MLQEHDTVADVLQHVDKIESPAPAGSVEDAFLFYDSKSVCCHDVIHLVLYKSVVMYDVHCMMCT